MRVLYFIPAFVLAATTSLISVAAIPAPVALAARSTGDNKAAFQNIVNIITNATKTMKPLHDHYVSAMSDGTRDPNTLDGIVGDMKDVLFTTTQKLEAAPPVDMTGLDAKPLEDATDELISEIPEDDALERDGEPGDILSELLKAIIDLLQGLLGSLGPGGHDGNNAGDDNVDVDVDAADVAPGVGVSVGIGPTGNDGKDDDILH